LKVKGYVLKLWRWEPFRRAAAVYLVMRIGLSVWAVVVLAVASVEAGPSLVQPYGEDDAPEGNWAALLLGPWWRFDTVHYTELAVHWYQPGSLRTVFPPLYPFLIRVIGGVLRGRYLLAALLISNLCALGYLTLFFALAEEAIGPAAAKKALVYVVLYPWAFILLAGYTEPLSLFMITLAFWMMWHGRGWAAGLFGALAALARLQGALLVLPLLFEALRRRRFRILPIGLDLLWPMLPPLASVGFLLGRAWAGIEPISTTYAVCWRHASAFPWVGMVVNVRNMVAGVAHPTDYLDFAAAWLFIMLVVIAWRQLQPAYAIYVTVALLFNISHIRMPHPMCSVGRHAVELFPAFFVLGLEGHRGSWRNRIILYVSIVLLLYLSGQFVLGGWVG
jgi:Gpi18-like mannosyltransferase